MLIVRVFIYSRDCLLMRCFYSVLGDLLSSVENKKAEASVLFAKGTLIFERICGIDSWNVLVGYVRCCPCFDR